VTVSRSLPLQTLRLGEFALRVNERLEQWQRSDVAARLVAKDPSLWASRGGGEEVTSRLGWVDLPAQSRRLVPEIVDFARQVRQAGIEKVLLVGMGGSSLAPEVFEATFGDARSPFVVVADSTHPDAVQRWIDEIDSESCFCVVSSKSGSTLETRALAAAFWDAIGRRVGSAGRRFAAITDPGSSLEAMAEDRAFSRIFRAPKSVGGRFSALSSFGLVPAALSGVDVERLLERASAMLETCGRQGSPGLALGAALGELALAGRDKLTFLSPSPIATFPNWIEQLVAESLGKSGRGVVPIVDEPAGDPDRYGDDRVFVGLALKGLSEGVEARLEELETRGHPVVLIRLEDRYDLGAEMIRWEVAVAMAAVVLEVQPFDQPDVESTKVLTRQAMSEGSMILEGSGSAVSIADTEALVEALSAWQGAIRQGDYIAIQAFIAGGDSADRALRSLQATLGGETGCAVSRGYGPRYLHSTGQLHKGGSNTGVFLQLCDRPSHELSVPGEDYSFGTLVSAQADGDAAALRQAGRRLLRVSLQGDTAEAVSRLEELIPR
jgi:transaldolase/glucose-6-phosphate isomerase